MVLPSHPFEELTSPLFEKESKVNYDSISSDALNIATSIYNGVYKSLVQLEIPDLKTLNVETALSLIIRASNSEEAALELVNSIQVTYKKLKEFLNEPIPESTAYTINTSLVILRFIIDSAKIKASIASQTRFNTHSYSSCLTRKKKSIVVDDFSIKSYIYDFSKGLTSLFPIKSNYIDFMSVAGTRLHDIETSISNTVLISEDNILLPELISNMFECNLTYNYYGDLIIDLNNFCIELYFSLNSGVELSLEQVQKSVKVINSYIVLFNGDMKRLSSNMRMLRSLISNLKNTRIPFAGSFYSGD